jgi:hypothetical protein
MISIQLTVKRRAESSFLTCNVTKNYFVTLFFISLRCVIRYVTVFNDPLRYCVTLHNFFVTLRFFRYVTFRVQIPDIPRLPMSFNQFYNGLIPRNINNLTW